MVEKYSGFDILALKITAHVYWIVLTLNLCLKSAFCEVSITSNNSCALLLYVEMVTLLTFCFQPSKIYNNLSKEEANLDGSHQYNGRAKNKIKNVDVSF